LFKPSGVGSKTEPSFGKLFKRDIGKISTMTSFETDKSILTDIADAIVEIKAELGTLDFRSLNEFNEDEYSQQAIAGELARIGTAAALLSDEFKDEYGTIDWNVLVGLQFAGDDQELELDSHSEWSLLEYDLTEIQLLIVA